MTNPIFFVPGTATPDKVLSGQSYSAGANYNAQGTMPNNGQKILTPSGTGTVAIPAGYHDGTGYVQQVNVPAADVLAGTTIAGVAGTMPENGALGRITPGTADIAIPAGHTTGGTVAGDPNLIAANILQGISIFGVAGSVNPLPWAKGTATPTNNTSNGTTATSLNVTGLSFTPRLVMARIRGQSSTNYSFSIYASDGTYFSATTNYNGTSNGYWQTPPAGFNKIVTGGFLLYVDLSNQYDWLAIG